MPESVLLLWDFFHSPLLLVILLFSIRDTNAVKAATPTLTAASDVASAGKGDTVNVTVSLDNNQNFSTIGMALSYDSDKLAYEGSSWSKGFSADDMTVASDTGSEVNLSAVCADSYGENGALVTVQFQALQNMDAVPVSISLRDMSDASMSAVSDYKVKEKVGVQRAEQTEKTGASDSKSQNTEEKEDKNNKQSNQADAAGDAASLTNTSATEQIGQADMEQQASVTQSEFQSTGTTAYSSNVQSNTNQTNNVSSALDYSYKTGVGLGVDWLLIIGCACGILAMLFASIAVGKYRD